MMDELAFKGHYHKPPPSRHAATPASYLAGSAPACCCGSPSLGKVLLFVVLDSHSPKVPANPKQSPSNVTLTP